MTVGVTFPQNMMFVGHCENFFFLPIVLDFHTLVSYAYFFFLPEKAEYCAVLLILWVMVQESIQRAQKVQELEYDD